MACSASAARPAGRISRSRAGRSLPSTSCRCAAYLAAIAIFCNEVKGKSMLALSRDLGVSLQDRFRVWLHKLREAMAEEMKGRTHRRRRQGRGNRRRLFRRLREARQPSKSQPRSIAASPTTRPASARSLSSSASATAIRSRPCSVPKAQALSFIKRAHRQGHDRQCRRSRRLERSARPLRNEAHQSRGSLSASTALARTGPRNFSAACAAPRSATIIISPAPYLLRYAQEASWREDNRRVTNGEQVQPRCRAGDEAQAVRGFLRILAEAHSVNPANQYARG